MTTLNLYQKLLEVRKSIPYLKKEASANNGGGGFSGYNYNSSSQVIGAVRQKLDELGVLLITKVLDKKVTPREKQNTKGGITITFEVELDLEYTWVNAENPSETIVINWFSGGVDTGDNAKAVGKALTYAEKYFMLKQFNIPTDNADPDFFQKAMEDTVVIAPDKTLLDNFVAKANEFANLRGQTLTAVYKVLNVKDIAKVTQGQMLDMIPQLDSWIAKAKKDVEKKQPQQA